MGEIIKTPEGRLIVGNLFEKDVFTDEKGREGKPRYKVEMAFDPAVVEEMETVIVGVAVAEWGEAAEKKYDDGVIKSPILDGDKLADKREAKGKSGDAYRDMVVIRASTEFNKHGESAPGGVFVCGPDAAEIGTEDPRRSDVYNGCYGVAVVEAVAYPAVGDGKDGVTLYLKGFQKTRDGDPLRGGDVKGLFAPVEAPAGDGESKGRRRRRS